MSTTAEPLILSAPDLQLDCLESDDEEDGEEEQQQGNVHDMPHSSRMCTEFVDSGSSDAPTTSTDSGEDGSSSATVVIRPQTRFRSASTSDSGPPPKTRRLTFHRDPFGHHHNNVLSSYNNVYLPHAILLRHQQLTRELQRRFRTVDDDWDLPLSVTSSWRRRLLQGRLGNVSHLLQLLGMRGLNMGLRQEVIEQHTTTSKYQHLEEVAREEDREKCTICLANFEENIEIRTLACKHCFHTDCVDRWLKASKQCPMCRLFVDVGAAQTTDPSSRGNPPTPPPPPAPSHQSTL